MQQFSLLPSSSSNHHHHLQFLLLSILSLTSSLSGAVYQRYSDCAPKPYSCGDIHFNLIYPLQADGRPDYCGHTGYFLSCTNSNLTISINNLPYQVKAVDNMNHLLTIVDASFIGQSCPDTYHMITLDPYFEYAAGQNRNLTLYYNCPDLLGSPSGYEIGCLRRNGLHSYYKIGNSTFGFVQGECIPTVVIPMTQTAAEQLVSGNATFGAALQMGFVVRWTEGQGWCTDCADSGGVCGFLTTAADEHACFCPNGPAVGSCNPGGKKKSIWFVAVIVAPILLGPFLYYLWWRSRRGRRRRDGRRVERKDFSPPPSKDLTFVDLAIIQAATSNFSESNKLGEGGFGPVYKGTLHGGRDIAVKRLSAKSKQGAAEFKSEVKLIAKLQHKNLVRMLGCCVEREEKLLIYEYLPNGSLDLILFDPNKCSQLDWRRRHDIVAGIARGLLYLHEDSLLKVIHRDLKASNVLLDNKMNPKISDFGTAKILEAEENEASTNRVVGTYGYMAPEYAMDGIFSAKSDVYSFGVVLLEILSGQKNGRSHLEQHGQTLLRRAWQLWFEGKATELMDPLLGGAYPANEAMKFIHIGLLCVQENVERRPTMSSVVQMLQSEHMLLPQPMQPITFLPQRTHTTNSRCSINEVTNSDAAPR